MKKELKDIANMIETLVYRYIHNDYYNDSYNDFYFSEQTYLKSYQLIIDKLLELFTDEEKVEVANQCYALYSIEENENTYNFFKERGIDSLLAKEKHNAIIRRQEEEEKRIRVEEKKELGRLVRNLRKLTDEIMAEKDEKKRNTLFADYTNEFIDLEHYTTPRERKSFVQLFFDKCETPNDNAWVIERFFTHNYLVYFSGELKDFKRKW